MSKYDIAILGAGESGTGAAILARKKGMKVFVSDAGLIKADYRKVLLHHEIDFEAGKHSREIILAAGEIVKSPGIPDQVPVIRYSPGVRNAPPPPATTSWNRGNRVSENRLTRP